MEFKKSLKVFLVISFYTITLGFSVAEAKVRYDNYKIYHIQVKNSAQFQQMQSWVKKFQCHFWNEVRHLGDFCGVMMAPTMQQGFEYELKSANFSYKISVENVQRLIDEESPSRRAFVGRRLEWTNYHDLDDIEAWLLQVAESFPAVASVFTIGRSYEGRIIKGIKISYKEGNKAVFIESNIHAREWITSATITYVINELLTSRNASVRDIAENLDWYIIPVLNVDGFVYSHEVDRIWRKSRRPSDPTGTCIGTDLNRNFGFKWKLVGASSEPCSEIYAGPFPESDPEVHQLVQYINQSIPDSHIKIYISLHSYGQYVLSPWGHTDEMFPENYDQMQAVARGYVKALMQRYGTIYKYGSSATTLYKVSGSGKDWAHGVKGIPITYTIELRDKGQHGFLLPPEQIVPVATEFLDGLVGMIATAQKVGVF